MKTWTFEESLTVATLKKEGHDDALNVLRRYVSESDYMNIDVDELREIEERVSASGRRITVDLFNATEEKMWRKMWEKHSDYRERDKIVIIEGDDTVPLLRLLATVPDNENARRIIGATVNPEIVGVRGYLILY